MEIKSTITPLFCSVIEAGKILGIGRSSIFLLLDSNALRSVKHGKRRLVIMESVTSYAAALISSQAATAIEKGI